jgi:hypothetical protein
MLDEYFVADGASLRARVVESDHVPEKKLRFLELRLDGVEPVHQPAQ